MPWLRSLLVVSMDAGIAAWPGGLSLCRFCLALDKAFRSLPRASRERLLVQSLSALSKDTPTAAVSGHPALRLRELAPGFVDGPSMARQRTARIPARTRCAGFSSAISPRPTGPRVERAASCRQKQRQRQRQRPKQAPLARHLVERSSDRPARPIDRAVIPAEAGGIQLPGQVFADAENLDDSPLPPFGPFATRMFAPASASAVRPSQVRRTSVWNPTKPSSQRKLGSSSSLVRSQNSQLRAQYILLAAVVSA